MQRRVGWVIAVVAVLLFLFWLFHSRSTRATERSAVATSQRATPATSQKSARADPRTIARASIRGTVRDDADAPIANARVCATVSAWFAPNELAELAVCASTDATGAYRLADLLATDYEVSAGARLHHPAFYEADPRIHRRAFALKAGEARTIDFVLPRGGVEITGTVHDIAGGPIAHALVRATRDEVPHGPIVETDAQGAFSLWVDRGPLQVTARADGYAPSASFVFAPDALDILLTPESSLAGRVLDATTREPIEGARVMALIGERDPQRAGTDITDAEGRFRIEHLAPGRYQLRATTDHRYGVSHGSLLVGLGQHVEDVLVLGYPAHQITGRVVVAETKQPTDDCMVGLGDERGAFRLRAEADGRQVGDGVVSGEYRISLFCNRYHPHDNYPRIVIADADVTDLTWEVESGATIVGRVTTHDGEPVDNARVMASGRATERALRSWSEGRSQADGTYALTGLLPGSYELHVMASDRGVDSSKGYDVEIPRGVAQVERDLVLDVGGQLTGHVADAKGKPVRGVDIMIDSLDAARFASPTIKSDAKGDFHADALRPGSYQVVAMRSGVQPLHKPGTTDDVRQGERVEIRAGETTTVQLVVESLDGAITGVVLDATDKPVPDAFVSSARESDAAGAMRSTVGDTRDWWGDDAPVLTATDGRFRLEALAPGRYTLRAHRKGGGEAIAEHVAVGGTATLRFKPSASIAGTARTAKGASPTTLKITVHGTTTEYLRSESFYHSAGAFKLDDLPAGHYEVIAAGDGSQRMTTLDLADGEVRTGLAFVLEPRIAITGRVVERGTERPIAGMHMEARAPSGGAIEMSDAQDSDAISDDNGRFIVRDVPAGALFISGLPNNYPNSDVALLFAHRTAAASASIVDIGVLTVLRARIRPGQPVGLLGIKFAEQAEDTSIEQRELKISWIDPAGPAAKTDLKLGDVLVRCDGIDITGENQDMWPTLSRAPPGTKLALTTKRGPTITVTLAAP